MPRPVPYREIFVHGPAVEGVHLRWGPVARGGIRWSDRVDDYRSEVLDLMRAQVLKNAVIVPTGAKGGFVVKQPAVGAGRERRTDAARAYEIFVACLLEVTDNVVGDEVVAVPRRRDGDDPYLVVAADKGTASLLRPGQPVSTGRGFWLGDAFASGGSQRLRPQAAGHHRPGRMGGGAPPLRRAGDRRAVRAGHRRRHRRHVGRRVRQRHAALRPAALVAAFDHRDIFLDPDPDPAASFAERARLFALPRSSWQDYDRSLLSAGGGVWSRLEKRIALSDEVRAALRVDGAELSRPS